MKLFTKAIHEKLLENGKKQDAVRGTDEEIDFSNISFDEMDVPDLDGLDDIEIDDVDLEIDNSDNKEDSEDAGSVDDIVVESLESLIEADNAPTEDEEEND